MTGMKTQISIPDPLFEAAEVLAERLGKSRDELYAEAIQRYLDRHRLSDEEITARLNAIFEAHPEAAEMDPALKEMQFRSLPKDEW